MRRRLPSLYMTARRNRRVNPVRYSHGKREFANRRSSAASRHGMLELAAVHNVRSYTALRPHFHAWIPALGRHAFSIGLHDASTFRRMDLQGQPGQFALTTRKPYRMEYLPLFSLSEFMPIYHPALGYPALSAFLPSKWDRLETSYLPELLEYLRSLCFMGVAASAAWDRSKPLAMLFRDSALWSQSSRPSLLVTNILTPRARGGALGVWPTCFDGPTTPLKEGKERSKQYNNMPTSQPKPPSREDAYLMVLSADCTSTSRPRPVSRCVP